MAQWLLYLGLTYTWGGGLRAEVGPEVWLERPTVGAAWVQLAPAVVVLDSDEGIILESRMSAWLQRPSTTLARP